MLITYGRFGVYATAALIVNALMILGIMAIFNATLTLPGIAGFVLTIGAAVDANVLINERIREEQRRGRKILDAIETGYKEASTAIFDANITNVIAAALMFYFGSGPIRGFAVVLMIGIVTSVFTAVNFTRMLVALWVKRSASARAEYLRAPPCSCSSSSPTTPTSTSCGGATSRWSCRSSRPSPAWSLVGVRGLEPRRRFRRRPDDPHDLRPAGRRRAAARPRRRSRTWRSQHPGIRRADGPIRSACRRPEGGEAAANRAASQVRAMLTAQYPGARIDAVETVSGKVSEELATDGALAITLAMLGIAIYIWFRFEWQFGVGALVTLFHDVSMILGFFALTQLQVDLNIVAAFLAVVGYTSTTRS